MRVDALWGSLCWNMASRLQYRPFKARTIAHAAAKSSRCAPQNASACHEQLGRSTVRVTDPPGGDPGRSLPVIENFSVLKIIINSLVAGYAYEAACR